MGVTVWRAQTLVHIVDFPHIMDTRDKLRVLPVSEEEESLHYCMKDFKLTSVSGVL